MSDEILVIRPGENHRFQADARTAMEQLYLGFSFAFDLPDSWNAAPPEFLPSGPWTGWIRSELRAIHARVREHGKNGVADPLHAQILQVISRVVGAVISRGKGPEGPEPRHDAPIPLAKEYILSHLRSRLSVPELAREFCLSPKYFGEIFKRTTGTSVREYQQRARMLHARQLLMESSLSVTEIAAEVGIENLPYFSRLFKSQFRISPRQARRHRIPAPR
jgi:AraC-like DNA-binding protein